MRRKSLSPPLGLFNGSTNRSRGLRPWLLATRPLGLEAINLLRRRELILRAPLSEPTSTIGRSASRHRIVAHVLHPFAFRKSARCCNMYHNLGHLAAFVCELAIVAVRGIEGIGLVAIT